MDSAEKFLTAVIQTSGGAAVLFFIGKWLLSDWLAKQKEIRTLENAAIEKQISSLDSLMKDIKIEVSALKDRIYHNEKVHIEGISRMNVQAEKFVALSKAMEGFAKTTNERLTVVETKSDQVIRIGKQMAARIAGKKINGSEND